MLESEMNRFLPLYPQVILCLYDMQQFGGDIVVDLLRTHPKVLFGGMVTFIGLDVLRITYAPDPIVCSSTLLNLIGWFVGLATVS